MKKVLLLTTLSLLFANCSSKKNAAEKKDEATVQFRDDFRSVSDNSKTVFLKGLNATSSKYSVIILTKGFMGEEVTVTSNGKRVYKGNPISHLETGIAGYFRIGNTVESKITDKMSQKIGVIEAENAKKYKFIYIMKENGNGNPYKITYSNTLRPLK